MPDTKCEHGPGLQGKEQKSEHRWHMLPSSMGSYHFQHRLGQEHWTLLSLGEWRAVFDHQLVHQDPQGLNDSTPRRDSFKSRRHAVEFESVLEGKFLPSGKVLSEPRQGP